MPRHTGAEAVEQLRKHGEDDLALRLQHYVNEANADRAQLRQDRDELQSYARDVAELLEQGPPVKSASASGWKAWAYSCALGIRRYILGEEVDMGEGPLH